jgi:RimJ/RimL family protein N-acetyltransferase
MERMGVAIDRMPPAKQIRENLEPILSSPNNSAHSSVLAWCLDSEAIGHSSLKDIVPGESGNIHLHLWRADLRGRGHGPRFFCLAAIDFYDRFQLKRMWCEPKADNPAPNRLLQRLGFPLLSTRVGASSELSAICLLNRYDIQRRIAETCLGKLRSKN